MQQRQHGDIMSKQVFVDGVLYTMHTIIHTVDNVCYECIAIREYANGDVGMVHLCGDGSFIATRIYKHGNVIFNFNGVDGMQLYNKLRNVNDGTMLFDGELKGGE